MNSKKTPKGASLRAPLEVPVAESLGLYWYGLRPDHGTSRPYVTIAGICFMTVSYTVHRQPGGGLGEVERRPHAGMVSPLSRSQIEKLIEVLPRKVLRRAGLHGPQDERDAGEIMDTTRYVMPPSVVIHVPSPEEVEALVRKRRLVRPFVPRETDIALADLIWCVPVAPGDDRLRPAEVDLPEPVAVTGIALPGDENRVSPDWQPRFTHTLGGTGKPLPPEGTAEGFRARAELLS